MPPHIFVGAWVSLEGTGAAELVGAGGELGAAVGVAVAVGSWAAGVAGVQPAIKHENETNIAVAGSKRMADFLALRVGDVESRRLIPRSRFHRKIRRAEAETLGFALPPAGLVRPARRTARRTIKPSDRLTFL
jgi:hypothetical protein